MHSTLVLAATTHLVGLSAALAVVDWTVPHVPADGLTDLTFPINIAKAPHVSGYYFAQQFGYVNGTQGCYTGLQPRPDVGSDHMIQAIFSSFIPGSTSTDSQCSSGADGGSGVSCSAKFAASYADTWLLVVESTGTSTWSGKAVNSVSGVEQHIGSFTVPATFGGLSDYYAGFVEYYPWNGNKTMTCADIPSTQATFFAPTTKSSKNGAETGTISGYIDNCKSYVTQLSSDGAVEFTIV